MGRLFGNVDEFGQPDRIPLAVSNRAAEIAPNRLENIVVLTHEWFVDVPSYSMLSVAIRRIIYVVDLYAFEQTADMNMF